MVYAAHASAALVVSHQCSGLLTALQSRHSIGVAQGVLLARYNLTLDQSFKVLVRLSRDNNIKLREIATQVVKEKGIPAAFMTTE